ncbi:FliG C-terminal domain-containing protein [Thiomicrorhabdus sp. 6S3-12]|uniref:FliG C-terminal domain-containing protein n=1 Tax=Thiomicrorhabdus sp. 6S3-12 TaxID=2819681 RepID=UPI001AACB670|nr:FliG C-terminal domain-containing protein [Thiomicrorhabdus sp. 6S3-12]MBO1923874.1 hypothetical protein [Thiomicrorhabdus sp. 6S3-12]
MQVGIKKIHENEWQVHIGCAALKVDRFTLALLQITLEHLMALERGEHHSTLQSYIKLGLRIKALSPSYLQKLLRELQSADLVILMRLAGDETFNQMVMENSGGILSRQISDDLQDVVLPSEALSKDAIRRIVEKTFELEATGVIEFLDEETRYI